MTPEEIKYNWPIKYDALIKSVSTVVTPLFTGNLCERFHMFHRLL